MRSDYCRLIFTFLLLFMVAASFSFITQAAEPADFENVAESRQLKLLINRDTTEIAVQHKDSGNIWYSNPPGEDYNEQLVIQYFDPADLTQRMNNFEDSIELGQFDFTSLDNGIKITYNLGEEWADDDVIPLMISQERMEDKVLANLEEEEQEAILAHYNLITLRELREGEERASLSGVDLDELLGDYTLTIVQKDLSVSERTDLIRILFNRIVDQEAVENRSDIQFGHLEHLLDVPAYARVDRLVPWDRQDLIDLFNKAGYTPEDAVFDHSNNFIGIPERNIEIFQVSLEYVLKGDSLVVRVPIEDIEYPVNVYTDEDYIRGASEYYDSGDELLEHFGRIGGDEVTFPLHSIEILPYFGASPAGSDGYLFIPDGSGALVDTTVPQGLNYRKEVYGQDKTVEPGDKVFLQDKVNQEQIHLPVFGIKDEDTGFLAIIEGGDAFSRINARMAGRVIPYNRLYSDFVVQPYGQIELEEVGRSERGGDKMIHVFPDELPREDIQIRYTFLEGSDANYSGMAKSYREYLLQNGVLPEHNLTGDIPFHLHLKGAVPKLYPVMGVSWRVSEPMTRYNEVITVTEDFRDLGIENIDVRYTGWMKGGIEHRFPANLRLENNLGTRDEFMNIAEAEIFSENENVDFFPDVRMLELYPTRGFRVRRDASERLNRDYAFYELTEGGERRYNLSPGRLEYVLAGFMDEYEKLEIGNLSLRDLGSGLNSDFAEGENYDRISARNIIMDSFTDLAGSRNMNLMVSGANKYALPFTRDVVTMPLNATEFRLVSDSVPFYQMVVHGSMNYVGEPLNFSDEIRREVLRMVEGGSYPSFLLTFEDSLELKNTDYDYLYTTQYQQWIKQAEDIYREVNEVLKQVRGEYIREHQKLEEGLFLVEYENNKGIIVNYNKQEKEYEDIVVAPESFSIFDIERGS